MDKNKAEELWIKSLKQELSPAEREGLDIYLSNNPEESTSFKSMDSLWNDLDEISAAPSPQMDAGFYNFIHQEEKKNGKDNQRWLSISLVSKWSYAAVLIIGVGLGLLIKSGNSSEMQSLLGEVETMKQMMALTLIEQPATQDRMKAVSMVDELVTADERVLMALIKTLNEDPSVNVRLKVIESLYGKKLSEDFRSELVMSISVQDNPLVQTALADLMVAIQEKSSVKALKELLDDENTNPFVKEKINESLQVLI